MVIETLREQYARLGELDERISQIERRLRQWQREDSATPAHCGDPRRGAAECDRGGGDDGRCEGL